MVRLILGLLVLLVAIGCGSNPDVKRDIHNNKNACCIKLSQLSYQTLNIDDTIDIEFGHKSQAILVDDAKSYAVGITLPKYHANTEVRVLSRITRVKDTHDMPSHMYYPVVMVLDKRRNVKKTIKIPTNQIASKIETYNEDWLPIKIALTPEDRFLLIQSDPSVYYKRFSYAKDTDYKTYSGSGSISFTAKKTFYVDFAVAGVLKIEHKKQLISTANN